MPTRRFGGAILGLAIWLLAGSGRELGAAEEPPLRVAAASDLVAALGDIGKLFTRQTAIVTVFSFGSSGQLSKQIVSGAPFDLFASANASFVDAAVASGACQRETKQKYALGRLALYTGERVTAMKKLADLSDARFVKIAIANPEHAPYGKAAVEALKRVGIYEQVKSRLVFGENVQQALQFARSGNAEAALVALALTKSIEGHAIAIEPNLHEPIEQTLVVCGKDEKRTQMAKQFVNFLNAKSGQDILQKYGFALPEPAAQTNAD